MIQAPIALALVRRADGLLLTLQGLMKVDLPGTHARPGARLEHELARRLEELGILAPRLVLRWGAVAVWGGNQRPISVFDARGWAGTPSEVASWSTEAEIARGARQEVYRRLFAKLREGGDRPAEDASGLILEAPTRKPSTCCPKCGVSMRLRNRLVGNPPRWDCAACSSSFELRGGVFERTSPPG